MTHQRILAAVLFADFPQAYETAELLALKKIDSVAVENPEGLLRLLTCRRVDALIIEQKLGGFLTGLEVVERLHAELFRPSIIIVGQLTSAQWEKARGLGVVSAVEEPPKSAEFMTALLSRISSLTITQSAIPYAAKRIAADVDVVPPLPQVLNRLFLYLHEDAPSLSQLADELSTDPRSTAELLRLTNASASGLSNKVTSVHDAVTLLGARKTISTVISTGALQSEQELAKHVSESIRTWYHTRSVLMATTAAAFAERFPDLSTDTAHVLGLLQDIGILAMAKSHRKAYEAMLRRARSIGYVRLEGLERQEFGLTHAEVSAALLEKWGLPQSLVNIVLDHHPPERRKDHSEAARKYLNISRIAEAVANFSDVPDAHRRGALATWMNQSGPRSPAEDQECIARGLRRAAEFGKTFSVAAPDKKTLTTLSEAFSKLSSSSHEESTAANSVPKGTDSPGLPQELPSLAGDRGDSGLAQGEVNPVPVGLANSAQQSRKLHVGTLQGRPPHVLLIDDEESVVRMTSMMLKSSGFDVTACRTIEEAPREELGFDLVLCDVHLGTEKGLNLIKDLRLHGLKAPVVMISGDRTRSTVMECIDAGIVGYVAKPFTRSSLISKLEGCLTLDPTS